MRKSDEVDFDPYRLQAEVYDAIYTAMKNYPAEARRVMELVAEHGNGGITLLDVACGTGLHLKSLRHHFEVAGCDISEPMLDVARKRLGIGIELVEADMSDFDLGRRFSAVTCLFSAIGHMRDMESLERAIECMANHLEPGGVLIVEPWITPVMYDPDKWKSVDHSADGNVTRVTLSHRFTDTTSDEKVDVLGLDMHYFFGSAEGPCNSMVRMNVTMFTHEQYIAAFKKAGLIAIHDGSGLSPNGRGVYIGIKPR